MMPVEGNRAEAGLTLPPGWHLLHFDSIDSTNAEACRQAEAGTGSGPDDALVVWASSQTTGRGRRGRAWTSPAGNLHFSVLFRPQMPFAQMALASFVAALGVVDGIRELAPRLDPRCKWPNDVLCGDHKVSGILLEAGEARAGLSAWLVIGIGINVGQVPDAAGLLYPATSLKLLGCGASVPDMLEGVCRHLDHWWREWRERGFGQVRDAWLDRAAGLGGPMTVRLDRETVVGRFGGLADDGALLLDLDSGGQRRVLAGDVFFGAG